jgi:hypothetical protein
MKRVTVVLSVQQLRSIIIMASQSEDQSPADLGLTNSEAASGKSGLATLRRTLRDALKEAP